MRFTVTVEPFDTDEGRSWEARIEEYPDVIGCESTAYHACLVALGSAIELHVWRLAANSATEAK